MGYSVALACWYSSPEKRPTAAGGKEAMADYRYVILGSGRQGTALGYAHDSFIVKLR